MTIWQAVTGEERSARMVPSVTVHEDQDEAFLLIEGHLTIQMPDRSVELGPGELFVIPRGTEHCPAAREEARFLLVGPEITSNAAGGKPYTSAP